MEEFPEAYAALGDRDRSRFAVLISRLMGGQFIMPEGAIAFDTDWHFLLRHRTVIETWLGVARFDLVLDETRQIATVAHRDGRHRLGFDKFTSLVLCQLRLNLHEAMMHDGVGENDLRLTVGELKEALKVAGYERRIAVSRLKQALLDLRRADLIAFDSRSFSADDRDEITLSVALDRALSPVKIQEIRDRLRAYARGKDEDEAGTVHPGKTEGGVA